MHTAAKKENLIFKITTAYRDYNFQSALYNNYVKLDGVKNGNQRKMLKPSDKPEASFMIFENDEIEAVYEYCNLHGLWKA